LLSSNFQTITFFYTFAARKVTARLTASEYPAQSNRHTALSRIRDTGDRTAFDSDDISLYHDSGYSIEKEKS